jgi:hypothetical protein
LGLPHTSRQLKAIAGDGFDANVCADVYNLYVIKKYILRMCIFLVGNSFTVLWIVDLLTTSLSLLVFLKNVTAPLFSLLTLSKIETVTSLPLIVFLKNVTVSSFSLQIKN